MLTKKRLLNNAAFSAIQTVVSAVLLFFLYRFLLKQLGAEQLGIWAIVLASTSVGRLTDMGLAGAIVKFVANSNATGQVEKSSRLVQTAALTIGTALAVLALLALPLLHLLLQWVLPTTAISPAMEILPYAIASLFFTMISGIFQSGIDACHRMDVKNIILVSCNIIYIAITVFLVPRHGLLGIAIAQTIQSILLVCSSWLVLKRLIPTLPILPYHWHKAEFREMLGYATNFQIGMLAGMFFDPVTKFFLAKYGNLSQTAYYEMANQLLQKARSVIVSAQQALVPEIAGGKFSDQKDLTALYQKSYGISFLLVLPYYIGIALALPLVSILWIGHYEPFFVVYGAIASVGWFAANLSAVPYFFNIGTGALTWNTANHILNGLINITLGAILGYYFSGIGVVFAAACALTMPNLMLIQVVNKRLGLGSLAIVPLGQRTYLLLIIMGAAIAIAGGFALRGHSITIGVAAAPSIIFATIALLTINFNPTGKSIFNKVLKFRSKN
ncbi:MAG: oligosaccharide flippase family protein [Sideroxyarcus sp.]